MPEGPEIRALAYALTRAGIPGITSFGKHLLVGDEDWSFGLNGRVRLTAVDRAQLQKIEPRGGLAGTVVHTTPTSTSAVDWATATLPQLRTVVDTKWRGSRKQLGALLLEQKHDVAGIGIAWGSEILHAAGRLRPDVPANRQCLDGLADAMMTIRDTVWMTQYVPAIESALNVLEFVNAWCENLYAIRQMAVYCHGHVVLAQGRKWWMA